MTIKRYVSELCYSPEHKVFNSIENLKINSSEYLFVYLDLENTLKINISTRSLEVLTFSDVINRTEKTPNISTCSKPDELKTTLFCGGS